MSHNVKLGRPTKVLVGLATAWVALYAILLLWAFGLAFSQIAGIVGLPTPPLGEFERLIVTFIAGPQARLVAGCSGLLYLALVVFYVSHISRNTGISTAARLSWSIGIIFLPIIAMPAYYARYT